MKRAQGQKSWWGEGFGAKRPRTPKPGSPRGLSLPNDFRSGRAIFTSSRA